MARNIKQPARTAADLDIEQHAPEEGGTPGIPLERIHSGSQPNASHHVMLPKDMIGRDARDPASEAAPRPKRFSVVGGPYRVSYNNFPYVLTHGKILSEQTSDIAFFRAQGVRLEPIPDQEAPQAPITIPDGPSALAAAQADAASLAAKEGVAKQTEDRPPTPAP
jgi:hypothetical protein